jgi:RecA/RadA recombinase
MAKAKKKVAGKNDIDLTLKSDSFLESYIYNQNDIMVDDEEIPLSTGVIPIDVLLGGGLREGDFVMLYGSPGIGKSTVCLQLLKKMIDIHGKKVLYLDTERAVRNQIKSFGLEEYQKNRSLQVADKGFKSIKEVDKLFMSILEQDELPFDLIVIDSITNLEDSNLFERSPDDPMVAGQAKSLTNFLKKYRVLFSERGIITLIINQERAVLGAMAFQKKTKSAGCQAVHYVPDIIISMRKHKDGLMEKTINTINGLEKAPVGRWLGISCDKSRKSTPSIELKVPLIYKKGIINQIYISDVLVNKEYVKKQTGGVYIPDTKLTDGVEVKIRGYDNYINWVKDNYTQLNDFLFDNGDYKLTDGDVDTDNLADLETFREGDDNED